MTTTTTLTRTKKGKYHVLTFNGFLPFAFTVKLEKYGRFSINSTDKTVFNVTKSNLNTVNTIIKNAELPAPIVEAE